MPRNKFKQTHGMSGTPTHKSWTSMKSRCLNPNFPCYIDYGARGITVCEKWMSFENFLSDMGIRPDGTTLDRIDNKKGYSPDNCRWATKIEQQRNTSLNRIIEFNGERLTQAEWSERVGIKQSTISYRMRNGWTPLEALSLVPRLGLKRIPPKRVANGRFASKFGEEVGEL